MPSYSWLSLFRQAQDEPDLTKLHERVMNSEYAILERLRELRSCEASDADTQAEYREIRNALNDLLRIKSDRLHWPTQGIVDSDGNLAP